MYVYMYVIPDHLRNVLIANVEDAAILIKQLFVDVKSCIVSRECLFI